MRETTRLAIVGIVSLALFQSAQESNAQEYRYAAGVTGEYGKLTSGNFFSFKPDFSMGGYLRYHPGAKWFVDLSYSRRVFNNDYKKDSSGMIDAVKNNSLVNFKSDLLGISLGRYLYPRDYRLNLGLSFDAGALLWRVNNRAADTTVKVHGSKGENTTLSASELTVGGTLSVIARVTSRIALSVSARGAYLTGAGVNFEDQVLTSRDRWLLSAQSSLSINFGSTASKKVWPSDGTWDQSQSGAKSHPKIVAPSMREGMSDADHDGVADSLDDCPATPREAAGLVDIHGCPVDADFDGVPDYEDKCPGTPAGAMVDSTGCEIDSDGDHVPDGIDDCPDTPTGVPVDRFGCIDLSMFSKPIVLHIDYAPGSFEIDPKTKDKLKKISGLLLLVPDVKLDVTGYTDNIGLPEANQKLSEKRANRVRDYLVAKGVTVDRIKSAGRGEQNNVATNDTAENRAKNRRIEIMFYR